MTEPQRSGWLSGHTKLVTIASIVAVGAAGAFALGANIGILDAADDSAVGSLAAAGDLTTPATQVVDVYVDDPPPSTTTAVPVPPVVAPVPVPVPVQEFGVDVAGSVSVATIDSGIRLDRVRPSSGWSWKLAQQDPAHLIVTLTDGTRTFEFLAAADDGVVAASVNELVAGDPPIGPAAPAPTVAPAAGGGGESPSDDGPAQGYEGGEDDD